MHSMHCAKATNQQILRAEKFAAHMSSDDITLYDEYSRFVRHAMEHLEQQQHRIRRALRDRDRHTLRRAGRTLTLHMRGFPILSSTVVLAGRYDHERSLWRWGWTDRDEGHDLSQALEDVRAVGESRGFHQLTRDSWTARRDEAWQMVSIATLLLDGRGAYTIEDGLVHSYYVLLDPMTFESSPTDNCEW
jgi:hypothetical protein